MVAGGKSGRKGLLSSSPTAEKPDGPSHGVKWRTHPRPEPLSAALGRDRLPLTFTAAGWRGPGGGVCRWPRDRSSPQISLQVTSFGGFRL